MSSVKLFPAFDGYQRLGALNLVAIYRGGPIVQPLSYQSADHSCWIACMINGIHLVTDSDRISTPVYRILHSLICDKGVFYDTDEKLAGFDAAIKKVKDITNLNIYYRRQDEVQEELIRLLFNRCVAVIDIGNGGHSILLHNRTGDWFEGFDPWWYGKERGGNRLLKFPKGSSTVNVQIHRRHLFAHTVDEKAYSRGEEYHMGDMEHRFLTVICRD